MRRHWLVSAALLLGFYLAASVAAGWWLLPPMLLGVPTPSRTEAQREAVRTRLQQPGEQWESFRITGGQGAPLEVWHLKRPHPRGVVVFLHGFGDDAWGTLPRAAELPDWDAVGFTFRGRDRDPSRPCTLGAWERSDVAAVVRALEARGTERSRIVLAGWSMGAGTALLALEALEAEGGPLGGALLECPFADLRAAASDHIRLQAGFLEPLTRPAQAVAVRRAGALAGFDPDQVSAAEAARGLRTPIALVTGDADRETPLAGVRRIAAHHPDLTVVPGAGHCQAGNRLPGGWGAWARQRLEAWAAIPPGPAAVRPSTGGPGGFPGGGSGRR